MIYCGHLKDCSKLICIILGMLCMNRKFENIFENFTIMIFTLYSKYVLLSYVSLLKN